MKKPMSFLFGLTSLLLVLGSCHQDDEMEVCNYEVQPGTRFFEFLHSDGDTYYAWTHDTSVLNRVDAALAKPQSERNRHINGRIVAMPHGCRLNGDWNWYFDPNEWDLAEISIEVCDGDPDYVQENLQDYLDIGRYCPWSAIILREIEEPAWTR